MTDRQFSDGELIYRMGDPADGVYRVRSGGVRLQRNGSGDRPEMPYLGAGTVFGDDGFLTGETRDTDAVAVGETIVEFLRRNEFLSILTVQPHLMSPLFEPVFNLVRSASDATADTTMTPSHMDPAENAAIEPAKFEIGGAVPAKMDIRIVADGRRLRSALGADEINVRELPFRIGRAASGEGKDTYGDIHLAIEDARPFNLSRRHFSIEEEMGALIVRDCGSYHGTTLNGQILGGEGRPVSAPLMTGESELVAGRSDSPFRFRILVQ
ncbi:MAG: hypothetical protein ACI9JL_002969 [Paracoccaceae bacterium]|jgi:hypothetical protein